MNNFEISEKDIEGIVELYEFINNKLKEFENSNFIQRRFFSSSSQIVNINYSSVIFNVTYYRQGEIEEIKQFEAPIKIFFSNITLEEYIFEKEIEKENVMKRKKYEEAKQIYFSMKDIFEKE